MKSLVNAYWQDEQAGLDDGIVKVLFIVATIAVALAVGYFAYNTISKQASKATNLLDSAQNAGEGHEFDGNMFG